MSEMSPNPEKPSLRNRIDALLFTLDANKRVKFDAMITGETIGGTAIHALSKQKPDVKRVLEHIPFHSFTEGNGAFVIGGLV